MLEINDLTVTLSNRELLHNISVKINTGARVLLSGHNGSGKSTLANIIAGNPAYTITSGQIIFNDKNITNENATTRALMGIFLGAQHVPEIPGLSVLSFLKHSAIAHKHFQTGHDLSMAEFLDNLKYVQEQLNIPQEWLNRNMNVGFSGGERKKSEILQLLMLKPDFAILDETDSGLDVDAVRVVSKGIEEYRKTVGGSLLIITHNAKILESLKVDYTHILVKGHITHTGDGSLVEQINKEGFEKYI
jgi:Fe-S cluster assembly ATP-binding protein